MQGPVYVGTGCCFRRHALYGFEPKKKKDKGGLCCKCGSCCCSCCGSDKGDSDDTNPRALRKKSKALEALAAEGRIDGQLPIIDENGACAVGCPTCVLSMSQLPVVVSPCMTRVHRL